MGVLVKERPEGSGIWWVFINHHGKRKSKKIGRNKPLALEVAKKIDARLVLGDCGIMNDEVQKVPTFKDYADTWISTIVPAISKKSTLMNYQVSLKKHTMPEFKDVPIDKITRLMIREFLMKKANSGLARGTINTIRSTLSGPLNLAIDDERIVVNPAQRIGKVMQEQTKFTFDPLTREELKLLLDTIQNHYPRYYPLALTLARTGMRLGEALALQWGDIDFAGQFIIVQRSYTCNAIGSTKTNRIRRVDMSVQLAQVLKELKKQKRIEAVSKGWGKIPEWTFCSGVGTIIKAQHWRDRVFHKALEKAGLRAVRTHDLRHGYASYLIQAGESLAYV
jgi:integrase